MSQDRHDYEVRLLLLAARDASSSSHTAPLQQELNRPFDGDRLVDLACQQEVHPLLARSLADHLWQETAAWEDRLAQACQRSLARNLFLKHELDRLLEALRGKGIQVLPLKGPELAERLYGSLELRTSGDLDLCVRGRDAEAAVGAIREAGYRICLPLTRGEVSRFLPFDKSLDLVLVKGPVRVFVDLHWDIAASEQMVRVDLDGVWERALSADGEGEGPGFSPEDLLLFLALHGYSHGWDILKLVCDVDRTVRRYDGRISWSALAGRAGHWMMSDILERALRLSAGLLETPLPSEAASCLAGRYWLDDPIAAPEPFIADSQARGRQETSAGAWLSRLKDRRGAAHRARHLMGSFHPRSMDFLSLPNGRQSPWMAWVLRPFRVAGKVAGQTISSTGRPRRSPSTSRKESASGDDLRVDTEKPSGTRRG